VAEVEVETYSIFMREIGKVSIGQDDEGVISGCGMRSWRNMTVSALLSVLHSGQVGCQGQGTTTKGACLHLIIWIVLALLPFGGVCYRVFAGSLVVGFAISGLVS
jgi:hypothetical protein